MVSRCATPLDLTPYTAASPRSGFGVTLVEVCFDPGGHLVWVAPETTVLAAATAAGVEIATGCTRGQCGTDAVRVVEGEAGLRPAAPGERGTLDRMGLSADFRLACSAVIERGPLRIDIDAF